MYDGKTELRRLLDEHNISHHDFKKATMWDGKYGENVIAYEIAGPISNRLVVKHNTLTPEQAVAVTINEREQLISDLESFIEYLLKEMHGCDEYHDCGFCDLGKCKFKAEYEALIN